MNQLMLLAAFFFIAAVFQWLARYPRLAIYYAAGLGLSALCVGLSVVVPAASGLLLLLLLIVFLVVNVIAIKRFSDDRSFFLALLGGIWSAILFVSAVNLIREQVFLLLSGGRIT